MIVVGIDGGGTKTELVAVDGQGRLLGRNRAGSTNLHRLGVEEVAGQVQQHVLALVPALADDVLVAACMSGVDTAAMQIRLTEALRVREPRWDWIVDNDATAAWWGAFGGREAGVVTIAGTGAVSYARAGTTTARAGGWGALLGDEGSGYSVGRAAIVAVLRAHDGMAPATALEESLLTALGLHETHELIDHVHVRMSFSDIAALAPVVIRVAQNGDAIAQEVLGRAADALVEMTDAAASRVVTDDVPLPLSAAFVGGLAQNAYFRHQLETHLAGSPVCRWVEPAGTAAAGAVLFGAAHRGLPPGWGAAVLTGLVPASSEER